jgi:hypothetical protein
MNDADVSASAKLRRCALAAGAFVQALAVKLKPRKIGPDVAPTLVEAR